MKKMSVIQSKTPSLHKKLVKQFAFSLKNDLKTYLAQKTDCHDPVLSALHSACNEEESSIQETNLANHKQSTLISEKNQVVMQSDDSCCCALRHLLMSAYHHDVAFVVEKELFLAHRHVLSARSTFFEAMFREESRWSETNKNTVPLAGSSAKAFAVYLCYVYGAFVDLSNETIHTLGDLAAVADMYRSDELLQALAQSLKHNQSHCFHAPCDDCLINFPEVLTIGDRSNMTSLKSQCLEWNAKYFSRIWCGKGFCELHEDLLKDCRNAIFGKLTIQTAVRFAVEADALLPKLTNVRWKAPALRITNDVLRRCVNFISTNLYDVTANGTAKSLFQDMGCRCHLVRQILDNVTEGLSAQNACLQFVATGNLASISDKEGSDEDVTSDIRRVTDKVNRYLIGNCYAIKHSQHWNLLPEDLRRTLMERSFGGGDASRKLTSKPVLTSSSRTSKPKARGSPAKARTPVQGALKTNSRRTTSRSSASTSSSTSHLQRKDDTARKKTGTSTPGQETKKPLKSPETSSTTRLDRSTAARGHVTPTRSHVTKNSVPAPELLPRNATQELRYGRAFYDKPTILRPYEVP